MTGGARLSGEVAVTGAKNSVLKLMAAALLAEGTTTLTAVPDILDVTIMSEVLRRLGCDVVGPATTAESALTLLRAQGRMDAALLDARQDVAPLVELLRRQAAALVLLVGEGEHPEGYSDAILLSRGADGLQVRRALVAALGRARAAMARA